MISLTSPIKTPWHRIRPGLKLLFLSIATFALFSTNNITHLMGSYIFVILLYAISGISFLWTGFKYIRPLWPFLLIIIIWHIATQSYIEGAAIALRLLTAVMLANLVTMTTRLSQMIDVMNWILHPLTKIGLKTSGLAIAIALVVRFTPVLIHKGANLADAWRARSSKKVNWRIITPFSLLALDDADHIAEALRARGGVE